MKECRQCKVDKDGALFHPSPVNKDGLQSYCIACQCENKRSAYQRNKEARQADSLRRYNEKKSAGLISQDEKAKKKEYDRQYRQKNKEKLEAIKLKWMACNIDKIHAIKSTYKAKRRKQEANGDTSKEIGAWAKAQPKSCYWCFSSCIEKYHIDHIMPLALGGKHVIPNLCISCPTCNMRKSAKHPSEWVRQIAGAAQ